MRWIGATLLVLAMGLALLYQFAMRDLVGVFTGGAAKLMCSAVFVGGRDPDLVRSQDFQRRTSPGKYLGWARIRVDAQAGEVRATLFGLGERIAIYRPGLGCTATEGVTDSALRAQGDAGAVSIPPPIPGALWPEGRGTLVDDLPDDVDGDALRRILEMAFAERDPGKPVNTRALLVVHDGRIIAERYADSFGPDTAHLSNSMAKTMVGALVGILVRLGRLDVDEPAPVQQWSAMEDPRGEITLDDLLRMRSGLVFAEDYSSVTSDLVQMYVGGDLAGYAASMPLEAEPGTVWKYSTGTSNILGRIVGEAAGGDLPSRLSFARRELFLPLGMRNSAFEVDGTGTYVGGSSVFASARDYAKFGLLYLNDGIWDGERILPRGWVAYTLTPTPGVPSGQAYGAQIWLNANSDPADRRWPKLPPDTFVMQGHQQQYVVGIPSQDLLVVRLGLSEYHNWPLEEMVLRISQAVR